MKTKNPLFKSALFFLLLTTCYSVKAQTLEHTYPSFPKEAQTIQSFRVSATETVFARVNPEDSSIYVYSSSHVLLATIRPDTPALGILNLKLVSRKLFDTDNDIEIVVTDFRKGIFVVNENGSIKFSELPDNANSGVSVAFFETDNGPKMATVRTATQISNSITKIYDLENIPYLGKTEADGKKTNRFSFPNPTATYITIPNENKQGQLSVYNTAGQLMDEKAIAGGDYQYDASGLSTGVYFYYLNGQYTGKFVKE